jgi:exosome complex component RRP42
MEPHVVSSAHGSVRFRLAETDVIVAAKVELGTPDVDRPEQGKIEFLVDW